ncbi:MAG: ABC transporter permease [Deltaproteobacteria bacterium]|nr:ABC transporter permease [Deltaproteobacteria bacterium]MBW2338732.1 ABC transporter permease [Deltaproteobacteria bacterium]
MWSIVFNASFITDFMAAAIRMTTPLTFAGLSCTISERSGVFNIGAEGMMLSGAFVAAVGALFTGSAWIGTGFACIIGALLGLLLAVLSITLGANQIISGVMINILSLGLTSFLSRIIMGSAITQKLPTFETWGIPFLLKIPVFGEIFFRQSPLSYISYAIAIILTFIFFKTTWGLSIRAAGENPRAVDTAGINVCLVRYICVMFSGIFASLGGAFLSVGVVRYFTENMSAGRGFIGLCIVILGKWHPLGAVLAALIFGAVDALQLRLQAFQVGIPYQFLVMLPYIFGFIAISGVVGRAQSPEAVGKPYLKES